MPAPTVSIGQLRHRVTIQQATETQGDDGSISQSWTTFHNGYAEIVPLSGSEDYIAQGLNASVIYRITMRHKSGTVPKMRILWGERTFEIESIRNIDERGRFMVMNCEEAV